MDLGRVLVKEGFQLSQRIGGRQWEGGRVIYRAGSKQGCVMAMSFL